MSKVIDSSFSFGKKVLEHWSMVALDDEADASVSSFCTD